MPSRLPRNLAILSLACTIGGGAPATADEPAHAKPVDIRDPHIRAWYGLSYDKRPPELQPGRDYGMDATTGRFRHPRATPMVEEEGAKPFPGQLDHWEQRAYAKNVDVIAFYGHVTSPFQTWQAIADFDGRRYMYVTYRENLTVWDITDPRKARLVRAYGDTWGPKGPVRNPVQLPPGRTMGAVSIQWSARLGKPVLVQASEVQRFGLFEDKLREPEGVAKLRSWKYNKGFGVYAMNGPLLEQWDFIAERTTDLARPHAPVGQQQGSGALDVPAWSGGKYMFLAAAPDDSYALTEYPNYVHSPGYQSWDMSDPANPRPLQQLTAPGQIAGDATHEEAYLLNPRAGNRTSWMGARMPLFLPRPVEEGGKLAFAAMGGLGLYTVDVSNPSDMKILGHLAFSPKVAGTEADNVDVSQFERTGYVFMNGYPMNNDCYEPYKDVFVIDARDPAKPKVAATFPRPVPPPEAPYTDFCQRRGSFGPKRPGYMTQPGAPKQGIVPYAFYNAGVQIFDVSDPLKPKVAGYYVPRFPKPSEAPEYVFGNLAYGIFVEYDRNIIWLFTNHGFYALGSPLLGPPRLGPPARAWPPRP